MSGTDYQYILGVGNKKDLMEGRGSIYYYEHRSGTYLPVFSTPAKAQAYVEENLVGRPQAHLDMLESAPESHTEPLTKGRFSILPYDTEGVAQWALALGVDYLWRDPKKGDKQEILPVPKQP